MPRVQRCKYPGCHALAVRPALCCDVHKRHEQKIREQRERYSRSRYNKYARNRSEEKKEQYNFYRSRLWSNLRLRCLTRDNYVCLYCLAVGRVTANSKIADHIIPIEAKPELKSELDNLATSCRDCHNLKTVWEREYYGTGQENILKVGVRQISDIRLIANLINKPR
ncbi:TPA: HNH endonuclease [Streptococcus pyogenes]|nr:HNH endonuclease [Streptococcus pyogenes]HEP3987038.1 HNH endonuclease [Streptococcus pyogenes]